MTLELERYILAHISPEPDLLAHVNREANIRLINGRMCSGHLQGRLLKMFVEMIGPKRVFEMGTFAAYSSLCIAEGLSDDAVLVTVENNDEYEDMILDTLSKSEHGHKVRLRIGDALEVASREAGNSYDMAFIDADKRMYPQYYMELKRIVRPGGYIIADNTLWDGHVVEEHSKSAQTNGIRRFNDIVAQDYDAEKVILPLRDGITIVRLLR